MLEELVGKPFWSSQGILENDTVIDLQVWSSTETCLDITKDPIHLKIRNSVSVSSFHNREPMSQGRTQYAATYPETLAVMF